MANLSLVFDVLAKDQASSTFKNVGEAAERAGKQTTGFGTQMAGAMKVAAGALLGAGLIQGFKSLYQAADESRKIAALTTQVIKSTGGAAQVSAKQVGDLAAAIAKKTGVDDEAIQSGQNLLLTFTNIKNQVGAGNDIFNQTTQIMTDMSVALGTDASGSAIQLGKALNDPIKGVTALTRVGVSFTQQQKDQIRTLVESGDVLGAQKVILAELGKEFGGAAEAAATPLGKLQQRLGDLAEQVGGYLVPAVDKAATFFNDKLLPAFSDIGSMVAGVAIPAFKAIATVVGAVADAFNALPGPLQAGVIAFGAFLALRGPLSSLFSAIGDGATNMALRMASSVGAVGGFKAAAGGLLGVLGGPWGLAITGATVGLSLLVGWLGKSDTTTKQVAEATQTYADALTQANGAITTSVRLAAAKAAQDTGILDVARKVGIALPEVTTAITSQGSALDSTRARLREYISQHVVMLDANTRGLDAEGEAAQNALTALNGLVGGSNKAVAADQQIAEAAGGVTGAMGLTTAATEEATEALNQWLQRLQGIGEGFVVPLSTYQDMLAAKQESERASAEATAAATESSSDSWKDYVTDVGVSLDEYATKLQEQLTAQDNWRVNIGTIARRGGIDVAQALADMGVEGVQLAAQMANGTDAEFQRMAALIVEDARRGGADAAAALDAEMKVMAAVGAAGGKATVTGIASELGIGIAEVQRIAAQYGLNLASGINPILTALGKHPIAGVGGRLGGFNEFYDGGFTGSGGKYTPAGVVHAGEFVFTKEQTNRAGVGNLEAMAKSLGGYATGGFVTEADVPRPPSTSPFGRPISTAGDAAMDAEYAATTQFMRENGPWGEALAWAKTQVGKPYIWGGVGPAGYDCSGFMSAITNVILGKSPYSRRGATANFPWPGFVSGMGEFTIGSTKNAGGGIGHMAGTLHGVNVESTGGVGVKVGGTARGATNSLFSTRAHLAMANGGVIGEPVSGIGHYSGRSYSFGERGPETVTPGLPSGGPVEITGTLAIGGDGLARIIDGRIVARDGRSSINARSSR